MGRIFKVGLLVFEVIGITVTAVCSVIILMNGIPNLKTKLPGFIIGKE